MKAVRLHGAKDLRLENIEKPTVGPDEFLVRVKAATICATDVRIYTYGDTRIKLPRVLGHEFAGDVEKIGANLRNRLKVGMRVTANPNMYCGRCRYCIPGRHELCDSRYALGIDVDGAFAEYLRVPPEASKTGGVCEVPDSLSYEEATLVEPLSCCLHGIEACKINVGDSVAIVGDGPIALLHLKLAKLSGAGTIIVSGHHDNRLMIARELGADATINEKREDPIEGIRLLTDGYGADVVIVAVGSPVAQQQALSIAAKGGRINFFAGLPAGKEIVPLNANLIHYKELSILGTSSSTIHEFRRTLELVSSGVLDVKRFITHRFPLDKTLKAFETASSRGGLKVCVNP